MFEFRIERGNTLDYVRVLVVELKFEKTSIDKFGTNRITAVCGDFYIGGRQFDSLPDLIAYYTYRSDLLKRERLLHPVAPPEPVNDKKRIVAILPYTKMPDTDELTYEISYFNFGFDFLNLRIIVISL